MKETKRIQMRAKKWHSQMAAYQLPRLGTCDSNVNSYW